jgi:hypothetical protein
MSLRDYALKELDFLGGRLTHVWDELEQEEKDLLANAIQIIAHVKNPDNPNWHDDVVALGLKPLKDHPFMDWMDGQWKEE